MASIPRGIAWAVCAACSSQERKGSNPHGDMTEPGDPQPYDGKQGCRSHRPSVDKSDMALRQEPSRPPTKDPTSICSQAGLLNDRRVTHEVQLQFHKGAPRTTWALARREKRLYKRAKVHKPGTSPGAQELARPCRSRFQDYLILLSHLPAVLSAHPLSAGLLMPITRAVMRYYGGIMDSYHRIVARPGRTHACAQFVICSSLQLVSPSTRPALQPVPMSSEFSTGPCLASIFGPSNVGGRIMPCDADAPRPSPLTSVHRFRVSQGSQPCLTTSFEFFSTEGFTTTISRPSHLHPIIKITRGARRRLCPFRALSY